MTFRFQYSLCTNALAFLFPYGFGAGTNDIGAGQTWARRGPDVGSLPPGGAAVWLRVLRDEDCLWRENGASEAPAT